MTKPMHVGGRGPIRAIAAVAAVVMVLVLGLRAILGGGGAAVDPEPASGVGSVQDHMPGAVGGGVDQTLESGPSRQRVEGDKPPRSGQLWSFDGSEAVAGCRFSIWRLDEGGDLLTAGVTTEAGSWVLPADTVATSLRVAFHLHAYCDLVYELRAVREIEAPIVLRLPAMGACEVQLPPALGGGDAIWQCNVEPWDPRFPERYESVGELRIDAHSATGPLVAVLRSMRFERLGPRDVATYMAPVGTQLVLGPWSEDHHLSCVHPRVGVPSVNTLTFTERTGLRIAVRNSDGSRVAEDGLVFARSAGRSGWRAFPMNAGTAHIERDQFADPGRVEVECCLVDGEFFRAAMILEGEPRLVRIEFVRGRGRPPIEVALDGLLRKCQGWVRFEDEVWEQMSTGGPMPTSARQIRYTGGALRICAPVESTGYLFLDEGTVVVFAGDEVRWLASSPSARVHQVVPSFLIQQLAGNEALVAELEAEVEGAQRWFGVEARRFVPAQESGAWSVKELPGVAYRTRWSRVAEVEGVWRAVETGVYEPFGPSGMPASSGR